jgi:uncharacterized membrane protein YjjP (DUF1212 family)
VLCDALRVNASVDNPGRKVSYTDRIGFVVELASRLHTYGTTAQRLESAIVAVARRLGLRCNPWSNPTGMILSFADAHADSRLADTTQVIRLDPGETDLRKLCAADAIAEDVLAGRTDLVAGSAALAALDRKPGRRARVLEAISYGLAAASVAGLLRSGWADMLAAAAIGTLIGLLHVLVSGRPRLQEAEDALSAMLATVLVAAIAAFVWPLGTRTVLVASIIVLMPGLTLTNAVAELTSQHLVSGSARFAGAMTTLLKLTFGAIAAAQLVKLFGWHLHEATLVPSPAWVEFLALGIGSYAFAVLFRADRRDYPLVMASVWLGYGVTRLTGQALGNDAGVFFGSLAVTAASNVYARWSNRPGALVRVPGIILLVPGSVGFRSLSFVLERDVMLGIHTGITVLIVLVALVAGVLFGNLLIPARQNL